MDPGPGLSSRLGELGAAKLQTVLEAACRICASDTNRTAAEVAVEGVRAVTSASQAVVFLRLTPHELSPLAWSADLPSPLKLDQMPPALEALAYTTAQSQRWLEGSGTATPRPEAMACQAAMAVPTVAQDQVWGVLAAYGQDGPFDDGDLAALEAVAQALAVVTAARSAINHFHSLWDGAPIGLASVDLEGRISAANAALAGILGLSAADLVGRLAADFLDTTPSPDWTDRLAAYAASGASRASVISARRADGATLVVETWSVPLILGGTPLGIQIVVRDLTREREATQRLEWLADHDPLTGLGNRRHLEQSFQTMRQGDPEQRLTLIYLDILDFSKTNEALGHTVGDRLLTELGHRLSEVLPPTAAAARVGSDDFAILLAESADAPPFLHLLDAIRAVFEHPLVAEDHSVSLRPAIGIALYPRHAQDIHSLLRAGAITASQLGAEGPTFAFYSDSAQSHLDLATQIAKKLPQALARGHLEPYYQPIVDLGTGRAVAAEALCRWHDPDLGLVYPSRFIPLAEESGLIREIGRFMISAACQQAARWRSTYRRPVRVQVNVSAVQFEDPGFPETVARIVADSNLPAGSLALELTESVLIRVREMSLEPILALGRLGIPLIIDDFGIGFSSLSYLHYFRVDELKLDRSFLEPGLNAEKSADLLRAMVHFAKSLHMLITVEGVEQSAQVAALRRLRFQRAQGYAFAPPLPAAACDAWLSQSRMALADGAKQV